VHDRGDLALALATDALLVGVNNRDLATMHVDTSTTVELSGILRENGRKVISMSGIGSSDGIRRLKGSCDAFLIGTAIMRSMDPRKMVEEFVCA
jgi:indole-3-glycerol phosphate synthase